MAAEGDEGNLVLERGDVVDVAISDGSLGQCGADASDVVHAEVGLLAVFLAGPDQNVGQQVGYFAFRAPLVHVAGGNAHHGTHHRVHLLLVGRQKGNRRSIRLSVVAAVDDDARAAHADNLIV